MLTDKMKVNNSETTAWYLLLDGSSLAKDEGAREAMGVDAGSADMLCRPLGQIPNCDGGARVFGVE